MILRTVFFLGAVSSLMEIEAVVTNEDIRLAILQIVNLARNTDDKLERHEFRERQLGEQLKKGLINIDKRIKMLDPLKGTVSRIDERLAAVETILMQKDKEDRERLKLQQKIYEAVLALQSNLPKAIEQMGQELSQQIMMSTPPAAISEPMMTKKDLVKMKTEVQEKMEAVTLAIKNIDKELAKIREENINSINEISNKSVMSLDKVKRQLDNSESLLAKYENKLAEYNNKIPVIEPRNFKEDDEWKENFLNALETQRNYVSEIISNIKLIQNEVKQLPSKGDIETARNTTLHKLEEIKQEIPLGPMATMESLKNTLSEIKNQTDKHQDNSKNSLFVEMEGLRNTLTEIKNQTDKNQDNVKNSFNELTEITSHLTESFSKNYEDIRSEIQNMGKMEKLMVQTADSVLDTKRRIEYGVHQIISEVEKQMKAGSNDINQGINERFESFELSILDEEYGALHNLTSKIQEEIGRVWRQIGIMHQQMSASADTLNHLQNQTDSYVSGSLNVMDSMKGKVTQITGRMTEVDENLNFLLGKLSLLSQEFNRIKTGLGSTLDEIRSSFQNVQQKIKDKGPGPHKISSNEITDSVATS